MVSPVIKSLTEYGTNVIISIKNNDKNVAKTLIRSMIQTINQYHVSSLYAIQYDIYNFIKHADKVSNRTRRKIYKQSDEPLEVILKPEPNIKMPADRVIEDTEVAEDYINSLIEHTKNFENKLCNWRNNYLLHNENKLLEIGKTKSYENCKNKSLEDIVKNIVKIL